MSEVPLKKLKVTKGADKLSLYQWNTKIAKHYFCSVCGIYTHHQRRLAPEICGYNIACFEDIDPFAFESVEVAPGAQLSVVGD